MLYIYIYIFKKKKKKLAHTRWIKKLNFFQFVGQIGLDL